MKLRRVMVGAIVSLSVSSTVFAQAKTSFAIDGSINPGTGKGGEFKDGDSWSWRVAASLTRTLTPRIGVFMEVAADPSSLSNGDFAVCIPSSRGGCAPGFPAFSSASAVLGLESGRQEGRFEVRAGVGGGMVSANHLRVGAVVTQADLGLFPLWHAGLVLGWRETIIPKFNGDRLSITSALVGLRLR
jgi:hypothetical protein